MKYEYKYVVPVGKMDLLRSMVLPFVNKDKFMNLCPECGYTVRSIYFDTPTYMFYHEKVDGLSNRKKIRIRGYNLYAADNIVFLEIKRKQEKRISKNRAPVKFSDLGNILSNGNPKDYMIDGHRKKNTLDDLNRFLFNIKKDRLMPTVLVTYEREAYFGKFDHSLRITFDKNLRGACHPPLDALYDDDCLKWANHNHFVFEVKFYDVFPSWLKMINNRLGLQLGSFSKYTTCIDNGMVIDNNSTQMPRNFVRDCCFT